MKKLPIITIGLLLTSVIVNAQKTSMIDLKNDIYVGVNHQNPYCNPTNHKDSSTLWIINNKIFATNEQFVKMDKTKISQMQVIADSSTQSAIHRIVIISSKKD